MKDNLIFHFFFLWDILDYKKILGGFIMNLDNLNKKIKEEDIFVLYIKSKTCSVCTELLPKVEEVAQAMNVEFLDLYIEENREVGSQYMVFSAPTIIVFAMGKEVYREGRFLRPSDLEKTISKYKELLL